MYKDVLPITIDDVIHAMKEKHSVVYKDAIKKAYKLASEKHNGVTRDSGEPYINHPVRVAFRIATWGLDNDSVIAALLHDVVEDCGVTKEEIATMFNMSIANLVDNVTSVDATITDAEERHLSKADIDKMSTTKLIKNMNRRALLIKIADRLDNLNTIDCYEIEKQIKKSRDTREILIPIAWAAGAYQLIDQLEEYCLKIEHFERYNTIAEAYNKLLIRSNSSTVLFLNDLVTLINSLIGISKDTFSSSILDKSNGTGLSKALNRIEYKKRSVSSLYRQAVRMTPNCKSVPLDTFNKENTAVYDITLIINDDFLDTRENVDVKDIFFQLYDVFLIYCGVEICSINFTTHGNSSYILIKDEMGNLYRVFVRTEADYLRYKIGDIVDGMDEFNFKSVDEEDPKNSYTKKIKVFRRDGSAMYIDDGATVLDFAFAIHTEIGLHFDYAIIDGDPSQQPPYRKLSEGDLVIIYDSEDVTPSLKWFKYVKTSKAIERLVKAISEIYSIPT